MRPTRPPPHGHTLHGRCKQLSPRWETEAAPSLGDLGLPLPAMPRPGASSDTPAGPSAPPSPAALPPHPAGLDAPQSSLPPAVALAPSPVSDALTGGAQRPLEFPSAAPPAAALALRNIGPPTQPADESAAAPPPKHRTIAHDPFLRETQVWPPHAAERATAPRSAGPAPHLGRFGRRHPALANCAQAERAGQTELPPGMAPSTQSCCATRTSSSGRTRMHGGSTRRARSS